MAFFSRLTDIVTCNLTEILARAEDPRTTLEQIIHEMEQGIAGAQRSMKTASENEARIRREIDEQRRQVDYWIAQAREHLAANQEQLARLDLLRKHEVENLIAGLEMQHKAAAATREHLTTTFRALEARLADARRRLTALTSDFTPPAASYGLAPPLAIAADTPSSAGRVTDVIDVELAALKRELEHQERSS
jgi:phage shock protein A